MAYEVDAKRFQSFLQMKRGRRTLRETAGDLLSASHLSKIENGGAAGVTMATLIKLSQCYEVGLYELISVLVGGCEEEDMLGLIRAHPEHRAAVGRDLGLGGRVTVEAELPENLKNSVEQLVAHAVKANDSIEVLTETINVLLYAVQDRFEVLSAFGEEPTLEGELVKAVVEGGGA